MNLFQKLVLLVWILIFFSIVDASVSLNCKFHGRHKYSCIAIGLENSDKNASFSEVIGTHAVNKSNDDVTVLVIKNQNVSFVPYNVGKFLPQLLRYEVQNSSLSVVTQENFKNLNLLETLVLSNNLIEVMNSSVFNDLNQLKHLRLSSNKLNQIAYAIFSKNINMEILLIDNNKITSIHENLFVNLINLKEIYLQNNEISDLREQTFANNMQLESIDISNNKLFSIGPQLFERHKSLTNFNFENNVCITQSYSTVEDLTIAFKSLCFPPYFERFESEARAMMESNESLNKSLIICGFDHQRLLTSTIDQKSQIDSLEEEKNTLNEEHNECVKEKENVESQLETCENESKQNASLLIDVSKNLTECKLSEEKALKRLIFTNTTIIETIEKMNKCWLQLETLTNAIQLEGMTNSEPTRMLRNEVDNLTRNNKRMSLRLEEITKLLKTRDNELAKLSGGNPQYTDQNDDNNDDDETKTFRSFSTKSQNELEDTRAQLKSCQFNVKTCQSQLPVCKNFVINCSYRQILQLDEYACAAWRVSACQPEMRIILDGIHLFNKSDSNVNVLDIQDSIFHFTDDIFKHFPYLRKIIVKDSGMTTLQPKLQSRYLKQLTVEENNFIEIPDEIFSGLSELESLLLDTNQIEKISRNSFAGLINLKELSLKGNNIYELPEGVFDDLVRLTHLSLKQNRLTSLSGYLLRANSMLEVVKFDENRNLNFIGSTFLDYSRSLRMGHFGETCVGSDYHNDIENIKRIIKTKCQL